MIRIIERKSEMKKLSSLVFMLFVFGLLLVGCSDSPKTVAKKWMQAIENGDVTEANKYSTERTHMLNGFAVSMMKDEDKDKDNGKFKEELDKLDNARVEIDGDNAKIYTSDDDDKPMTLKKVNGDWKVDVEK